MGTDRQPLDDKDEFITIACVTCEHVRHEYEYDHPCDICDELNNWAPR